MSERVGPVFHEQRVEHPFLGQRLATEVGPERRDGARDRAGGAANPLGGGRLRQAPRPREARRAREAHRGAARARDARDARARALPRDLRGGGVSRATRGRRLRTGGRRPGPSAPWGTSSTSRGSPPRGSPSTSRRKTSRARSFSRSSARRSHPKCWTPGRRQVAPVVDTPRERHEGELARRVHRDDLEAAVVRLRHRRDVHAAAEVATVADRDHERVDAPLVALVAQRDAAAQPPALAGGEGARAGEEVGRAAAERFGRARDVAIDEAAHPCGYDVDEPARPRRAVVARESGACRHRREGRARCAIAST